MKRIVIPAFQVEVSEDVEVAIFVKMHDGVETRGDSVTLLIARQEWISRQIVKAKENLASLLLMQNEVSEAYSSFKTPHFTENMGAREKCVSCGKLTSWNWNYEPHCKNNDRPQCFDSTGPIPLDVETRNALEIFFDENK